jgi:hypothetical protein
MKGPKFKPSHIFAILAFTTVMFLVFYADPLDTIDVPVVMICMSSLGKCIIPLLTPSLVSFDDQEDTLTDIHTRTDEFGSCIHDNLLELLF